MQRLEAFRLIDWERQGTNWRVPRSSLAPILRFADSDQTEQLTIASEWLLPTLAARAGRTS